MCTSWTAVYEITMDKISKECERYRYITILLSKLFIFCNSQIAKKEKGLKLASTFTAGSSDGKGKCALHNISLLGASMSLVMTSSHNIRIKRPSISFHESSFDIIRYFCP